MRQNIEELIAGFDATSPPAAYADADAAPGDVAYYIALDPLLAQLYKDYRDTQAYYARLDDGGQRNAAMRDVAQDMVDSAWSALQTRLIELREGDETVTAMQAMRNLRHNDEARLAHERARDNERQAGFRKQRETFDNQKRQSREEAADALLAYVFLFWFRLRWSVPETMQTPKPRSAFSQVA